MYLNFNYGYFYSIKLTFSLPPKPPKAIASHGGFPPMSVGALDEGVRMPLS